MDHPLHHLSIDSGSVWALYFPLWPDNLRGLALCPTDDLELPLDLSFRHLRDVTRNRKFYHRHPRLDLLHRQYQKQPVVIPQPAKSAGFLYSTLDRRSGCPRLVPAGPVTVWVVLTTIKIPSCARFFQHDSLATLLTLHSVNVLDKRRRVLALGIA